MRSKLFRAVLYVLLLSAMFSTVSPSFAEDAPSGSTSDSGTAARTAASTSFKAASGSGGGSTGGGDNYIFTGAATYAVPIAVPPGRLGMQPNLAIQYNSQKGNGLLGVGWDLTVASIQRNTTHGVSYAKDDFVFSSDGASGTLVKVGDASSNEYRMKIEDGSFMRFVYIGASSGWKVYDKSGMIYTFGSGDGGRQQDTPSKVFQWKLERVADTMGNSMEFFWFKDQGQIYLDRIEYTGNSTQHFYASNMVRFWYEPRTDAPQMYNTLIPVRTALRLKVVEVDVIDAGSWKPVRAYQLKYDVDPALPLDQSSSLTGRSLLTSVQMFGSDVAISSNSSTHIGMITGGSSMPATTFDYHGGWGFEDKGNWTDGVLNTTYANWDSAFVRMADVNGDNRYDVVIGPGTGDNAGKWYFLESYFDKTTKTMKGLRDHGNWVANGGTAYENYTWTADQIRVIDVNGDGRQDIVLGPTSEGEWMLLESTTSGFVARGNCLVENGSAVKAYGSFSGKTDRIRVMDVNGDGHADMVVGPDPDNGQLYYLEADGNGHFRNRGNWLDTSQDYKAIWGLFNLSQIRAIDVNGDGKQDIVAGPGVWGGWAYLESSADHFIWKGNPVDVILAYVNWQNESNRIRAMDVNGDGLQDIVMGPDGGGKWYVLRSTGSGFVNEGNWVLPVDASGKHIGSAYGNWDGAPDRIRVFDATGDGLQDIVIGPDGSGKWYLLESTGDGFEDRGNWLTSYPNGSSYGSWDSSPQRILNADFDGDGMTDILLGPDGSSDRMGQWHLLRSDATHVDLLASVRNGQGGTTVFEYTPSSHYENDLIPFVMPVVSAISMHDGFGNVSTTRYEYDSGYFDIKEREFRGFGYVKQTNQDLTTLETRFHQKDGTLYSCEYEYNSYHKGKPFVTVAKDSTGHTMSQTDMTWEYVMPLGGQYPVYSRLKQKITTTITNTTDKIEVWSSEAYTYDDLNKNGMVKSVEVSGTDAETVTTTNTYENFGYWAWRLTGTTVTGSASGFARETMMEYYPATDAKAGKLRRKSFRLDGAAANPGVSYEYDAFGNVVKEYDANNNMTERVYDTATRTFPEEVRYPQTGTITHVVKQQLDPILRVPKYSWDENGVKTTNWFDKFGRVTRTETYSEAESETIAETQMQYFNAVVSSNIEDVCKSGSGVFSFRALCMQVAYLNTQFVEIDRITTPAYVYKSVLNDIKNIQYNGQMRYYISGWEYFDGLGRGVQTVSMGENSKYIASNTLYDEMGRLAYTQGPEFVSGPSYRQVSKLQSSATIPFKSYFYNANGSLSRTSSPHETGVLARDDIFYSGLSTTVTDADIKSKTTKRDYLGRIIEVKESSDANTTITTTYKYNAVGDLTNITNGANVTEIKYDSLGRKISMTDPDMGYWMYCYDASGNMLRQLDPKRQIIEFAYDALNRVTSKKYFTVANNVNVKVGAATESTDLCSRTLPVIANTAEYPVTWAYDNPYIRNGKGRLFSMTSGASSTTHDRYDAAGRVAQVSARIDGNYYTTQYSYDYIGRLRGVQYPGGENFAAYYYYYPGSTLLKSVVGSDNVTYASFSYYNAAGSPGMIANGNGVVTWRGYQPATFNIKEISTVTPNPDDYDWIYEYLNKSYGFTPANDVQSVRSYAYVKGSRNYGYTYDGLHRLKSETGADVVPRLPQDSLFIYASPSHRLERIETGQSVYPFQYDKNGNMEIGHEAVASPVKRIITWNADNMPKSITQDGQTTAFLYDGSGTRIKKTGQYGITYYIGKHFEIVNGVKTKHIFAGGMRIAQISNGVRYYHHKDHLGSTTGVTDDTGWLVWASDYEPYGLPRSTWQKTPSMDSLIRHRFTDQEYDAETRLYNYNARLYDPSIARFISPDTIVDNPYSSLALNRYMYVAGNPLRYTDPSGHIKFGKFFKRATHGITRVLKYHARQGVTGITYDVNRAFERLCGSSDICEALEYPIDAVVAPTAFISAYAALVVTSPGKAFSDPAWVISNGMAAFNLSAPGQVINAGVTFAKTGSPRLAKPDKYGGYPIMKNSMFGYIGGDGFTPGPVSFIAPEKSNNNELIMHEIGHQMQYDQWGGWKYLKTGLSDAGKDGSFEYGADVNATNHFSSQLNGDSVCTYHSQNHPIKACRY